MGLDNNGDKSPNLTPFSLSNSLQTSGTPRLDPFPSDDRPDTSNNGISDYFSSKPPSSSPLISVGIPLNERSATTHAPIDHVPNEILSHILELAYFSEELPQDTFRTIISHASSRFRLITYTTPALWSKYHLTQGNVCDYLPHLPRYLQLSREYPLDIHLSCFWSLETSRHLMDLLLPHSHRWQHLSVTTPNADIFAFLVDVPAPMLESVSLAHFSSERRLSLGEYAVFGGQLPRLSSLQLRNVSLDKVNMPLRHLTKLELRGYGVWPDFEGLETMLGGSESLREITLHVKPAVVLQDLRRRPDQDAIFLPGLRTLTVFSSEWLTDDVARLIRVFNAPNIETLVVREGSGLGFTDPVDVLRYTTTPEPTLATTHSDIAVASRCLSQEQLENLRVLEFTKMSWRNLPSLQRVFQGMMSLQKLVLFQLNPYVALQDLEVTMTDSEPPPSIRIASLRTLDIDTIRDYRPAGAGLAPFIRLFSLPSLSHLVLRHICQQAWENTVEHFAARTAEYPNLTSLTLAGMYELQHAPCSPVVAFPRLKSLSMVGVPSNLLVARLVETGRGGSGVAWPDLETLMITGDRNASKPLLHKAIAKRQVQGRPLVRLYLDGSFHGNEESWEWIKDHVKEVVETS